MKQLITLLILIPNLLYSQVNGGIRLYLSSNTTNYETIIVFNESSTDLADNCCDAISFGQSGYLYTNIGQTEYVINSFSQLNSDRWIPIGVRCPSQTFEIGINLIIGDTIHCMIWDSLTGQLYTFPHQFTGPTNGNTRFKIFFEYPLSISLNNQCGYTQVIINDDESIGDYTLLYNGSESEIQEDTINLYSNGEYEIVLSGDTIYESIIFNIQNISNDYQSILSIPLTILSILDPGIIPTVQSNYIPSQIIWSFGDGTFSYDDTNPVHYYSETGIYTLTCTIISSDGCSEVLTSVISVYSIDGFEPIIKKSKNYPYTYGIDGKLLKKY